MVKITYHYPKNLARNATVMASLRNAADFVRDLWLARAPYASGEYAKGLLSAGSVRVGDGKIEITNFCKYADVIEHGFRGYNWGMRILNSGKGVKTAKDGSRYKLIHIDDKPQTRYRKQSVAQAVSKSFQKLIPLGLKANTPTKYGQLKRYEPKRALKRPLKPKMGQANPKGFFIVSSKTIAKNHSAWMMPDRKAKKLGLQVQKEASPLVKAAVSSAIKQELSRQQRLGKGKPKWFNSKLMRNPLQAIPVRKGR
jgi:hypothetical protein